MRRTHAFVLAAVLALAVAAPVAAHHEDDEPEFIETPVWFKHSDDTKAGNLAAHDQGTLPTWDGDEPTESVTDGAGAGMFGIPRTTTASDRTDGSENPVFEGTFTGDLEDIAFEIYLFSPLQNVYGTLIDTAHDAEITVAIDGMPVYVSEGGQFPGDSLPLEPAGDAVFRARFAITDLYHTIKSLGLPTGPDAEYDIRITFDPIFADADYVVYVYDTVEVPAGMTFNPADGLAGYTILPNPR